jgi:hypothetical protein
MTKPRQRIPLGCDAVSQASRIRDAAAAVTLASVLLAQASCTTWSTTAGLQPFVGDRELPSYRNGAALYLTLPGIEVSVSPGGQVVVGEWMGLLLLPPVVPIGGIKTPEEIKPPFPVEFRFYAWEPGFTFDPMDVELITPEGKRLQPTSYFGPRHRTMFPGVEPAFRRRYPCEMSAGRTPAAADFPHEHSDWPVLTWSKPEGEEFTIGRKGMTCFWLLFDTPVRYDAEWQLRVTGLKRSAVVVELPVYNLRRAEFHTFGTVP